MAVAVDFDARHFRSVLGTFPTGVAVVCGGGTGLVCNSFTSVSLDPPLVAFCPARTSTSWPLIRDAGVCTVNVLACDQDDVAARFARSGGDKLAGLHWTPAPVSGEPLIDGAVAWLDCTIERAVEAGDHWVVLARVHALDAMLDRAPLVFHRGAFDQL